MNERKAIGDISFWTYDGSLPDFKQVSVIVRDPDGIPMMQAIHEGRGRARALAFALRDIADQLLAANPPEFG